MLTEKSLREYLTVRASRVIHKPPVFWFKVHWFRLPTDVCSRRFTDRAIQGKRFRHALAGRVSTLDVRNHLVEGSQFAAK
jgi:hypothetical protein